MRGRDLVAALAGAVLSATVVLALSVAYSRQQAAPLLTAADLKAAGRRWAERGADDYDLDLVVTGRQASRYHVEVRGGEPARVLRNDRPTTPRTWRYWTVPGLFEVIDHDIDCADDPTRGFGAKPGSRAVLRARFDDDGLPRKFERLILGEPHLDMTWEIIRFEAVREPTKLSPPA